MIMKLIRVVWAQALVLVLAQGSGEVKVRLARPALNPLALVWLQARPVGDFAYDVALQE
jgi:hypothetical protein